MFVLRARATVSDASASYRVFGVGGPSAPRAIQTAFCVARPGAMVVSMVHASCTLARWPLARRGADTDARRSPSIASHAMPPPREAGWDWLVVQSGVPMITPATQDQFVAQAGNFDALGGIDFRKGCYTGQEIVARMQYLGRLKERLFAFRAGTADPPRPAHVCMAPRSATRRAGRSSTVRRRPEGGSRFLAIAQIDAGNVGTMKISAPDGPDATREPCHTRCPTRNRRAGASGTSDGRALLRLVPRTRRRRGRARRSTH